MKRRTLDIIFSIGGLVLAMLVLTLGLVLRSNAVFAKDYVHDQLVQQRITFTPAAGLSPEEQQSAGLVKYAGQPLTTGAQAQVYANDYIAGASRRCERRQDLLRDQHRRSGSQGRGDRRAGPRCGKRRAARQGSDRPRGQGADPVPWRDAPRAAVDLLRVQHLR